MVSTTIRFNKPDVQPPVYVAGSFSKWAPIEMNVESNDSTGSLQNHFSYRTDLAPGKYDYKFRLGPGDWWVLDESSPSTRDDAGNVNNVLNVEPEKEPRTTEPEPAEIVTKIPAAELRADETSASSQEPQTPKPKAEATNSQAKSQSQSQVPANIGQKIVKDEEPKVVSNEKPEKVTPDAHFEDGGKEDLIPDVAPPPYTPSLAESGAELTSSSLKSELTSLEDTNSRDNAGTSSIKGTSQGKHGTRSWFDRIGGGNVALVFAAIVVPVAVSYFWYR